jgi:hypothetical protein
MFFGAFGMKNNSGSMHAQKIVRYLLSNKFE